MPVWLQNGGVVKQNGGVTKCPTCPCGCPPFDGRTITYVDMHVVGGTGDGSSPANAYDDIQDAIDAKPRTEIQIQGYGKLDTYPTGISLLDCTYLHGIDNVWIDGNNVLDVSIHGNSLTTTKIDSINIKNSIVKAFYKCESVYNSTDR